MSKITLENANTTRQDLIRSFIEHYKSYGYIEKFPIKITSGQDESVVFIGSAISGLKKHYISQNAIPSPGIVVAQDSIRTRNIKNMCDTGFNPKWGSYFTNIDTISQYENKTDIFEQTLEFFYKVIGIPEQDLILRGNSNLSGMIFADILQSFKSIDFANMTYEIKTKLLADILEKIVYSDIRIAPVAETFWINGYSNPNNNPLNNRTYISADTKFIIIEKDIILNNRISTNQYDACGRAMLTVHKNNLGLIQALAIGWKYKNMYESGQSVDQIRLTENTAHRTVYKYLNLSYLSPRIIESIMESNCPPGTDLQKLFAIASSNTDFDKQENAFYRN